jgi:YceI-like domain
VTALIDPASVHTGNQQRDEHLGSADFLDVERGVGNVVAADAIEIYLEIEFTATGSDPR